MRPAPRDRTVPRWLELGFYAAVAAVGVLPALWQGHHVVGDGVDLYGTLWFFWWIQDCVVHLRDPSFTDLFFHPLGKDIFAHTGDNFLDALLSVPFQWAFRFPRYQPIFVAAVLVGNALAFRPLAARFAGLPAGDALPWWRRALGAGSASLAAFAATALWQTCTYALFEITAGRPTQAFLWFLPLALDRFLALEGPRARRIDALALGGLVALQALTYWFMGHFIALLFLWLAPWALLRSKRRRRLLGHYALAAGAATALVGPWVFAMLRRVGQGAVPGLTGGRGLLTPPGELSNNVATGLHGYWLMEQWGAPLLGYVTWAAVAVLLLWRARDRARWLGAAALLLVFSVGPALQITEDRNVLWYPYLLAYNTVPFLDRLWFPYRLVVLVFLVLCAALAGALVPVVRRLGALHPPALGRFAPPVAVGLLLALNLAEQHRQLFWPFVTRRVDPPRVFHWIGEQGGGLIHLPFAINQPAIVWQTVHGQPLFGGMGENAPLLWPPGFEERLSNGLIRAARRCTRAHEHGTRAPMTGHIEALRRDGFRWVILHRELIEAENRGRLARDGQVQGADGIGLGEATLDRLPGDAARCLAGLLGEPAAVDGPLVVWDLAGGASAPEGLRPAAGSLEARGWASEEPPAWEQVLRADGRLGGER